MGFDFFPRIGYRTDTDSIMTAVRWRCNVFPHYSALSLLSSKNAGFEDIQISAERELVYFPKRLWHACVWGALTRYITRCCWLQVFNVEISWEGLEGISFEVNLKAIAYRRG